ncbi:MAG: signal peptide peptidase SppA [Opitutales bacterium]|nr:signal peptide peptidase SppA [Opitutales bacterium]
MPPPRRHNWLKIFAIVCACLMIPLMCLSVFFALFMAVIGTIGESGFEKEGVPEQAVLVINLDRSIPDRPDDSDPFTIFQNALSGNQAQGDVYLRQMTSTIRKARNDNRIKGIALFSSKTGELGTSMASVSEIQSALADFQKSGKPVYAYLRNNGIKSYYLCSNADEVYMHPMGDLVILGFHAEQLYMKDVLAKLGIGVQVARVGEYKSAVEPFIADEMSDENRAQLEAFLKSIWNQVISETAKNRSVDKSLFNYLANTKGIISAEDAIEHKLADKIAFEDEFFDALGTLAPPPSMQERFSGINIDDYALFVEGLQKPRSFEHAHNPQVAVLYVEGSIVDGEGGGGSQTIEQLCSDLKYDDSVKAVVLRINSPGGSVSASEDILHAVHDAVGERPLVVSMGGMAASGGYWITANSDSVFADPVTLTGSIGVFGLFFNGEETMNMVGITPQYVDTHISASAMSFWRKKTDQEMQLIQGHINSVYELFIQRVAESRNLEPDQVNEIARGHIWIGSTAKDLNLVDSIGSMDDAIEAAAKMAGLNDYKVIDYPHQDPSAIAFKRFMRSIESSHPMITEQIIKTATKSMDELADYTAPNGIYARLPLNVEGL